MGLSGLFGIQQGNNPLPFAGSLIPFKDGHLDLPFDALMDCCTAAGTRSLPSDADILAVAQAAASLR